MQDNQTGHGRDEPDEEKEEYCASAHHRAGDCARPKPTQSCYGNGDLALERAFAAAGGLFVSAGPIQLGRGCGARIGDQRESELSEAGFSQ